MRTEETAGLEGMWRVERVAGFLPPAGVTKRIEDGSGWTLVAGIPVARFRVQGETLVYRGWPVRDELELVGGVWRGRGLLFGREFCRFRLVPEVPQVFRWKRRGTAGAMAVRDPLAIYLQDHLAGATFGVELVERCRRNNEGTEFSEPLRELSDEIRSDRGTLRRLMHALGAEPSRLKNSVAWASEKTQRLKFNGRLGGYSPLARVEELESLAIGIAGKRALWELLENVGRSLAGFDFAALREAAEDQLARVDSLRLRAAETAFASSDVMAPGRS